MAVKEHGSEEYLDYVFVHRALGQPRYTIKFYFIQLTTFEAGLTAILMVAVWWIIETLNLSSRSIFGLLSWELIPFLIFFGLPVVFSIIHHARPDLKILETFTGAFVPTQFKDLPDKTWKPNRLKRTKPKSNQVEQKK